MHHNGIAETLASMRENYWICQEREAVKRVIRRCVVCQKLEGKSYKSQPVTDLPEDCVNEQPPFNSVSIDFAWPLYVHEKEG